MTDSEIKIAERRMAEFVGFNFYDEGIPGHPGPMVNVKSTEPVYLSNWGELQFSKSFDWLIPVARACIKSYHDKRSEIFDALHKCDINMLFKACDKFILWYNSCTEKEWIECIGYPFPHAKNKS